ncbi:MAG: YoaK family protein [Aerococcus sp.]|nr:YoaK family protein [Aerococcus sp.]
MKHNQHQSTQQLPYGLLLTANSGTLTAFTYLYCDGTFAGFQSGNMVKLAVNIGAGKWANLVPLLVSLLSFMLGVFIVRYLQYRGIRRYNLLRRHRYVLVLMLMILLFVRVTYEWMPTILVNGLLSLCAASEFEEFRLLQGGNFTHLMMTGNLRTLSESIFDYFKNPVSNEHNGAVRTMKRMGALIGGYLMGALFVSIFSHWLTYRVIGFSFLVTLALLLLTFRMPPEPVVDET